MTITVINGPLTDIPAWSPSTVTFVRTKMGVRELGEPRVHGSFKDQVGAWLLDKTFGGRPQYWQIDITERQHPEVKLELFQDGGILKFDIRLNFNLRIIDARKVLDKNIQRLDDYITPALRKQIANIASRYDVTNSHQLQREITDYFGGGNTFSNGIVEVLHLTVQVQPNDPDAIEFIKKSALVKAQLLAIDAEAKVTEAQVTAFVRMTGGMTIDALAHVAIATGNPKLVEAYNNLRKLHMDEDQRNWERLRFLVDHKLLEPHDLEKYLGPLGEDIMKSLISRASLLPGGQKQIGKS